MERARSEASESVTCLDFLDLCRPSDVALHQHLEKREVQVNQLLRKGTATMCLLVTQCKLIQEDNTVVACALLHPRPEKEPLNLV